MMRDSETARSKPGLRARKKLRTREQLLLAAMTAFNRAGYQATTLDEIADAADVHKRTLLRYFPTKAHLVLDGQYQAFELFKAALEAGANQPVLAIWSHHVLSHSRKLNENESLADFFRIAASEPALRQAFVDIQDKYRGLITAALERELGEEFSARIKSRVVADALVAGNYSVASMIICEGRKGELEQAEREVLRLVGEGLLGA